MPVLQILEYLRFSRQLVNKVCRCEVYSSEQSSDSQDNVKRIQQVFAFSSVISSLHWKPKIFSTEMVQNMCERDSISNHTDCKRRMLALTGINKQKRVVFCDYIL